MGQTDTVPCSLNRHRRLALAAAALSVSILSAFAQPASSASARQNPDWRRLGNSSQLLGLASPAGGPVDRVWFSSNGSAFLRLPDQRTFSTSDFEAWTLNGTNPPEPPPAPAGAVPPEPSARLFSARAGSATVYAAGRSAWRSEDGGLNWTNLTLLRGESILGGALRDLAADPSDPERLLAATASGVWSSIDGGRSWQGLNDGLPNLPVRRLLAAPVGTRGVRIAVESAAGQLREMEWLPGQKTGWSLSPSSPLAAELELRQTLSAQLGANITAAVQQAEALYAGSLDGRLWVSLDNGATFRIFQTPGRVERIVTDPSDRAFALAAVSSTTGARVLRTLNGGSFWDDLAANLPDGPVYGLAADRNSGALYAATARGLFYTFADLRAPSPATAWQPLAGNLPATPARDVRLDDAGNLLLAAFDGHGVFSTLAPHRARQPLVVHSFDYGLHPAAPGALLSVVGAAVVSASANQQPVTLLDARAAESQIQIPYSVSGDSLQLVLTLAQGRVTFPLPLRDASPAILIDRDGSPMLMDADTGVQLDAMHPARPGSRIQILMSGLGRVQPAWPAGLAAPLNLDESPRVIAALRATLDGAALEVVRAALAPGLIGYYLVEVQLPEFLDSGSSALSVEAAGLPSNSVRLYLAQ